LRVGIVSDVHCEAEALAAALDDMGDVDEVLCLGDLIFQYRFSNDVMRIVRERRMRCVLGNHDAIFLSVAPERARSEAFCDPEHLRALGEAPETLRMTLGGKVIFMAHGSPWEPLNYYVFPQSPKLDRSR
jgi:predicted phosphodiesterase